MGNVMFQYASLRGLGLRLNATFVVPEDLTLFRAFNLSGVMVVSKEVHETLLEKWKRPENVTKFGCVRGSLHVWCQRRRRHRHHHHHRLIIILIRNRHRHYNFSECCRYYNETETLDIHREKMSGYFQSFRYFHPQFEKQIRKEFTFLEPIQIRARKIITEAISGGHIDENLGT